MSNRISDAFKIFLIEGNVSARDIIVELNESRDTMRKALASPTVSLKTLTKYCNAANITVSDLMNKAEYLKGLEK